MVSKRSKPVVNDPPPYRISFWLLLVITGCLMVGVRQMLPGPEISRGKTASQEPVMVGMKTAKVAENSVSVACEKQLPQIKPDDPWSNVLGQMIQNARAEDDPRKREDLVSHFLGSVKVTDIPGVLAALKDASAGELAADLDRQLIRRWAQSDPRAVALWIQAQPVGEQRQIALDNLAMVWANESLADAINWGQSLPDDTERHGALAIIANEAVRANPVTALQLAIDLPTGAQRDELIRRAALDWASGDPGGAVAWAEQIPDESLRAKVLAGESVAFAKQDPEAAATLAATQVPPGRLLDDTTISIVERWAQQQPAVAGEWVTQFPQGPLRAAAMENLVAQWSQRDAVAAQSWMAVHP